MKGRAFLCVKNYYMDSEELAYQSGVTYLVTKDLIDGYFIMPSHFDQTHKMKDDEDFYSYFLDMTEEFNENKNRFKLYTVTESKLPEDSIVKNVVESFKERSETGFKKYGTNLDRKDLNLLEWLNHLQMELQDAILYAEKLKQEYNEQKGTFNKSDAESKNSDELSVPPRS